MMIGRKLMFVDNNQNQIVEEITVEYFDLNGLKQTTTKHLRKYGFLLLITTLRFSIKSKHLLKNKYNETLSKLKNTINNLTKKHDNDPKEKEVSSFLRMISDYKHKVREIKHKIKEEEGIE